MPSVFFFITFLPFLVSSGTPLRSLWGPLGADSFFLTWVFLTVLAISRVGNSSSFMTNSLSSFCGTKTGKSSMFLRRSFFSCLFSALLFLGGVLVVKLLLSLKSFQKPSSSMLIPSLSTRFGSSVALSQFPSASTVKPFLLTLTYFLGLISAFFPSTSTEMPLLLTPTCFLGFLAFFLAFFLVSTHDQA